MPCNDPTCPCGEATATPTTSAVFEILDALAPAAEPAPAIPESEDESESEDAGICGTCHGALDDYCDCRDCADCGRRVREDDFHHGRNSGCDGCDRCHRCCDCQNCDVCGETTRHITICPVCDACDGDGGCCECVYCENCDERHREDTSWCRDGESHCRDSCECSDADEDEDENGSGSTSSPRFFNNPLTFHRGVPVPAFPSRRFAAVEIEVASAGMAAHTPLSGERPTLSELATHGGGLYRGESKSWMLSVVKDGSLPTGGFEINTSPASGDAFVAQISQVCATLNGAGAAVTKACGLHVHIDASKLSAKEVARVATVAYSLEEAVHAVVPPSRRGMNYCRDIPDFMREVTKTVGRMAARHRYAALGTALYTEHTVREDGSNLSTVTDVRYWARDKYRDARYSWVNLHSWMHRGTIEIRTHSGTVDADKITKWASFWAYVVDRVVAMTDAEAEAFVSSGGPWSRFLALCPSAEHATYFSKRREKFAGNSYRSANDRDLTARLTQFNKSIKISLKARE